MYIHFCLPLVHHPRDAITFAATLADAAVRSLASVAPAGDVPASDALPLPPPPPTPTPPTRRIGCLHLTALLTWRSLLQQSRRPLIAVTNIALPVFAAALLAGLNAGQAFFTVSAAGLTDTCNQRAAMSLLGLSLVSMATSVSVFKDERTVFFREASELPQPAHALAYFCGKDLAMLPTSLAATAAFTFLFHALSAPAGGYSQFFAPYLGTYLTCQGLGFLVSLLFPRGNTVVIGCTVVFVALIFGGTVITLNDFQGRFVPLNLAPYVSFIRYALEALYVGELANFSAAAALFGIDLSAYALTALGWTVGTYGKNVGILFGYAAGAHVAALAAIVLVDRDKRR